jgi:hypothetical protein
LSRKPWRKRDGSRPSSICVYEVTFENSQRCRLFADFVAEVGDDVAVGANFERLAARAGRRRPSRKMRLRWANIISTRLRSLSRITREPFGLGVEALLGLFDHGLGGADFGLADGTRRLDNTRGSKPFLHFEGTNGILKH